MRERQLQHLRCPQCHGPLELTKTVEANGRIQTGQLHCATCRTAYPIVGFVPRFVSETNYADSFGMQWNKFTKRQLDSHSGQPISGRRF